jgi:hypothetical protein
MEIKWNPYPETKPKKEGRYLITVEDDGTYVVSDEFSTDRHEEWLDCFDGDVTAWAELPEPYERPIRLKAYPIETVPQYVGVLFLTKCGNYEFSCYISGQTHPKCVGWTHWAHIPEFEFVEEEE